MMPRKLVMRELALNKSMRNEKLLLRTDDVFTIIFFLIQNHKAQNRFRILYSCYKRVNNHFLGERIDIEEILNSIASYFCMLFICPDTFQIQPKEVVESVIISSGPNLPPIPPNQLQNPEMRIMQSMLMALKKSSRKVIKEKFTDIQREFYAAVYAEGIIASDQEFTAKIIQGWSPEMFDLIIK